MDEVKQNETYPAIRLTLFCSRTTMESHSDHDCMGDGTSHTIILGEFENNKKYKERIVQETAAAICAMLNTNGGKVVIHAETDGSDVPVEGSPFPKLSSVIRILEQFMISITGETQFVSNINFRHTEDCIVIFIKKAKFFITTDYNLYLPSQTQVVEVSPLEPLENVKNDIMYRKVIPNPVELGSHCRTFRKDKNCGFHESKTCQLKNVKAGASRRTTLADRMTRKGNKFSCYVSAYANLSGGHIYYGITDDGVVEGEFIPNEKDKGEIIKKIENAINKMIWPEQIGQPKRGEHWEIFFEPVVDENSKPVPSTFVIVIYIAPCLGGVFTEDPECYEMVEGKFMKMSFATWKERISLVKKQPDKLRGKVNEISPVVSRVTWSSDAVRKAFTVASEELKRFVNNGDWDGFSKACKRLQKQSKEVNLAVLSKKIIACCAKGNFDEAEDLLKEYKTRYLSDVRDCLIFEVMYLILEIAIKRARGHFKGLAELSIAALSKADMIEPGLITATVYILAASVTDLIRFEGPTNEFSIRALQHLQHARGYPSIRADKQQRSHIILASRYLGCNLSGQPTKDSIDTCDISKAKSSIMAVHDSILEGNPLSRYREVQLKLVQSIYDYRHSQVTPDKKVDLLRSAFNYANDAECLAIQYQFGEMVEWSERNKALCAGRISLEN